MTDISRVLSRLRRQFLRHRRLVGAALAAAAAVAMVRAVAPATPPTVPVVVAARDLSGGEPIGPRDIRVVSLSRDLRPAGARSSVDRLIGETVAAPMRAGEVLTDRRLMGAALVDALDGAFVAAPVRIGDADVVALVQPGDHLNIYAATGDLTAPARQVVTAATVLTVPQAQDSSQQGALVVLALTSPDAARLAQASATTQLSVSLAGGSAGP